MAARKFLVAYNLYLDKPDMTAARAIAKSIRASGGGLKGVKAMGVLAQKQAQVSMNITDLRLTRVGGCLCGGEPTGVRVMQRRW